MRKTISHGTADDMLDAFQSKLNMLENSTNRDVESSTSVVAANKRSKSAHGTADQMLAAFEKRVGELEGNVDAASRIEASDDLVEYLSPEDEERYIHTLVGDTNSELEDLDIFDSWTWDYDKNNITLTTVKDTQVEEYTIPRKDLKFNWDNIEEDVQYIMQAVTDIEMDDAADGEYDKSIESAEDVVGATINDDIDDKSVVIPEYAKTRFYADAQGAFGGDEKDVYSLEDIMIMWNSEHNNDPSMSVYDSFDEWWSDTEKWLKPSSAPQEGDDDEMFTDHDGVFGNPGDVISKRDMRDYWEDNYESDPSLIEFNSFEDWWSATEAMLQPVEDEGVMSATSINASSNFYALVATDGEPVLVFEADDLDDANAQVADYNNLYRVDYSAEYDDAVDVEGLEFVGRLSDLEGPVGSSFTEIASKQVLDSDGFMTDYTMYRDTETGEYVFVFGDKDAYTPDQGDFDWSCDTEEEAWDWFNDYTGFESEYEDDEYDYEDDEML